MSPIYLSSSILILKLTPAEKILLARICQCAALGDGRCNDTNNELAQATAMHPKTVSDLIGSIAKSGHIQPTTELANKRVLKPVSELLVDYP